MANSKGNQESEFKIHEIIDGAPILLSFVDKNERYVFVNKHYEAFFGKKREDMEGHHIREVVGERVYQSSKSFYDRALSGETLGHDVTIYDHLNRAGRFEVNFAPIWEGKNVKGFVVAAHDITERWNRERDQELLGKVSAIYAANLDEQTTISRVLSLLKERMDCTGVWLAETIVEDEAVKIIYEDQTGTTRLMGQRVDLKNYGKELARAYMRGDLVEVTDVAADPRTNTNAASFDPLNISSFITIPLKRKGQLRAIISVSKNHPYGWIKQEVVLVQTVSEGLWSNIENSRLMLELKESIRARDEFIGICSHELKTPISSLKLIYQMSEKELNAHDPRLFTDLVMRKRINISNTQINRMSKLIDEMLEVSRITAGQLRLSLAEVDLVETVENVVGYFQEQLDDMQIKIDVVSTKPVIISADHFRIEQVITNLLTNAMKYGKNLPIRIEVYQTGQLGVLKVIDQGIGMDKNGFTKIFQRFERAVDAKDVSGLGLGLYITSQIVEAHHATISVDSEPGKGSTFTVEFPLKC